MAKVIGIISIKGGVGKTTTVSNLGTAISNFNKKVLLIDADFSSPSLGLHFGLVQPEFTLNYVLKNKITPQEAIEHIDDHLHLLVSNIFKEKVDPHQLKEKVNQLRKEYDYIIIDSSPTLNDDMLATMVASDELLVITSPDYPTLKATLHAIKTARKEKTLINGLILNRKLNKHFELTKEEIEESAEVPILGTVSESSFIPESIAKTAPATLLKPTKKPSLEFLKIASYLCDEEFEDPRLLPTIKRKISNSLIDLRSKIKG